MKGDCLDKMASLPANSVDLILCDLPYGTTACRWDSVIPMGPLWKEYRRLIKPSGVVVLNADQPFTSLLIQEALDLFRYNLVWNKCGITGHLNAKRKPLRQTEDILVFFQSSNSTYNPLMRTGRMRLKGGRKDKPDQTYGKNAGPSVLSDQYYPTNLIEFSNAANKASRVHPTEKPVALNEYLIKTYSNEGDVVLDNCFGSCSTGIACLNTNRVFIGIEKDPDYFELGKNRFLSYTTPDARPVASSTHPASARPGPAPK